MLTDLWNLACFAAYRGHSFWAFKEDLVTQTEFVLFSTSGTKQERSWWRHCHLSCWTGTQVPVPLSTYDHQAFLPCLALPFLKKAMKEIGDGYSTVLASPCSEVQVFLACPHE